jgi:hypothetical protein
MADLTELRETVHQRYARAATGVAFGAVLYDDGETAGAPPAALDASRRCGVPTAVADLRGGETHRVHEHTSAAIIRARTPRSSACCAPATLATCCDPAARIDCCGPTSADGAPATCGCIA